MNRREFVASIGIAAGIAGCAAPTGGNTMSNRLEKFGLQLSTVTPQLMADFPGTLRTVAQIGYQQVEFSAMGFLGREVGEVEELLAELGLEAPVGRVSPKLPAEFFTLDRKAQRAMFMERGGPDYVLENVAAALSDAKRLKQSTLVLPALPPNQFGTMAQVEANIVLIQQAGELCAAEGIQFGYHNHNWELVPIDDQRPYDLMLEQTDARTVTFQLDAYWVRKGGGNLFDYLNRFPGRFSSCHMKDIDAQGDFADVGDGLIDFPRFTKAAIASGARYFFVERDGPPAPMESAKRSYAYLSQMTF